MTLLEKFDSVDITIDAEIGKEDLEWCVKEEGFYKTSLTNIHSDLNKLEAMLELEPTLQLYEIPSYDSYRSIVYRNHSYKPENAHYLVREYTSAYSVLFLRKSLAELPKIFVNSIIDYFNTKYDLGINKGYLDIKHETLTNYREILKFLKENIGHLDFNLLAHNRVKQEFCNLIYRKDRVILKNKTFTIKTFSYTGYGSTDCLKRLFNGIDLFEHDSLTGNVALNCHLTNGVDYALNTSKAISVRFFENGRCDIKFASNEFVTEFYNFFNINSLG